MKINPINTQNNTNTNFKTKLIKNPSIDSAYSMIEENASSVIMKNMDFAKDFLDSMRKIISSKKTEFFNIFLDKRRPNYTYININGRRVYGGADEFKMHLKDDYMIVEGCNKYASKLNGTSEPTELDIIKNKIETTERKLCHLKEQYSKLLKQELTEQQLSMVELKKS